jgi:hypothetical protein
MKAHAYREPAGRSEPRPVPDYEAIAARSQGAARRRGRTTLVLLGVLGALFVCLRFFRMPAEVEGGLVVIGLVLTVVSDVVRHRPD